MCAHALMRALLYAIRAVGGRDACGRKRGGGCVLVPGQRRLAFTSSKIPKKIEEEKKRKKTYFSVWPVSRCNSNPVMASQTTTCMPSARAGFDPQLEYATGMTATESLASIVNWQG